MLAFCTSARFVEHATGPHHPERPDRIRAIFSAVREAGLIASPNPLVDAEHPALQFGLRPILNPPAILELEPEPIDVKWLEQIHPLSMIRHVERVCSAGGGVLDLGDTPVCAASYDIALLSAGGVLKCCDAVMRGDARRAFAAGRPPGHHAEPSRSMGFCLFANVAVAARYLQKRYGVGRVAIVDFDVHHGNGTQACFIDDPSVYFISLHQDPRTCYPGTGYNWETGNGPGRGFTMNIPFNPGTEDAEYLAALDQRVLPTLADFKPEILLLSAGFDAHQDDPLASLSLTDAGFATITRRLVDFADGQCGGRVISSLEGGYNLAALGRSVVRHMVEMG